VVAAVSADLMVDPAIGPEMIEPLRSLGVQAMAETGMQIGLVFKTRPGRQFTVRSAVFSRIKLAFAARGIRIASTLTLPLLSAQGHGDLLVRLP
jgi:small-conductance mechanosensitive channel